MLLYQKTGHRYFPNTGMPDAMPVIAIFTIGGAMIGADDAESIPVLLCTGIQ